MVLSNKGKESVHCDNGADGVLAGIQHGDGKCTAKIADGVEQLCHHIGQARNTKRDTTSAQ